jgi:hypothetical protein
MSSDMSFAVSRHSGSWRTGLVLLALLCGCEERKPPSPAAQTPREVEQVPAGSPSPEGRFTLVLRPEESPPAFELYEVKPRLRLARVAVEQAAGVRPWNPSVQWTVEDHPLLRWSTGSASSTGLLYDTHGTLLLALSGTSFSISPSARYLVTYPTLLSQKPVVQVYDLATGKQAARGELGQGEESAWVIETLDWEGAQLLAIYRDPAHVKHALRLPLPATP